MSEVVVSHEDIAAFEADGAVCLRQVVDRSCVERMRTASDRVLAGGEGGSFRTMLYLWKVDPDFRDFSLTSPLPAIAAAILQSAEVRLFADQLLIKQPGSIERTPWHQDLPYWPIRGDQLCTIWVALDPVSLDSGAIEYIRGSHRWGKWYKPVSFSPGAQMISPDWEVIPDFDTLRDRHAFLLWDVEPGDCIIHHPLVVHGAGGNSRADRPRRAVAPRYIGDDVRWNPPVGLAVRRDPGLPVGATLESPEYPKVWPR